MSAREFAAALALVASGATAAPDFATARRVGNVDIYWDDTDPARFYFAPGELVIARRSDGRPELHLLQLRWSGSSASGAEEAPMNASTLTLGVEMRGPDAQDLDLARRFLRRIAERASIELRPIPIRALDASITFAPIGESGQSEVLPLPEGHFEEAGPEGASSFWRERTYSVALDERSSQVLWGALQQGLVAFSVSYAFRAEGVIAIEAPSLQIAGGGEEAGALRDSLAAALGDDPEAPAASEIAVRTVRAGAVELRVDTTRWPDLLQRVDLDDRAPPGWAALRIYCFDFKDALRGDLFSKKVEIEAQAVNGRPVAIEVKFLRSRPELFAHTARFRVAVRLDLPFRFRVIEALPDGSELAGEWVVRDSWAQIVDVTSYLPSNEAAAAQ